MPALRFRKPACWAGLVLALACGAAWSSDPESTLLSAFDQIEAGNTASALKTMTQLTLQQPNFRLAQFIYGDLLAARSGKRGIMPDSEDPHVQELVEEARLRDQQAHFTPAPGFVPSTVLMLANEYPYLVVVDLPHARLNLFENRDGVLKLIRSSYSGMGRNGFGKKASGDLRTPVGIYHVTGWRPDSDLPELYGVGALPLNYPNLWDRFRVKTGYGIWLHGVPRETYVRAPRSSEGCVTMANDDLLALRPYLVTNQAPVILADRVDWVPRGEVEKEREVFLARIEDWRKRWASKDTEGYLSFYGPDFTTGGMNLTAFTEHKRRVNATKRFIGVELTDMSLYRYPGEPMMLAEFTLHYRSDNYNSTAKKQQYWRQNGRGEWKIFREENLD
jgi:murein L,D-transpeptidase YafK